MLGRKNKSNSCFEWELTVLAVRLAVLEEERAVSEQFPAVDAVEAFWVEVLADRIQAILRTEKY